MAPAGALVRNAAADYRPMVTGHPFADGEENIIRDEPILILLSALMG